MTNAELSLWINPTYLAETKNSRQQFTNAKPFPHLELPDFFLPNKAAEILQALSTEKFFQKEADLFKFSQTQDFAGSENAVLQEFRTFLSSPEFISFLSSFTQLSLKPNSLDISGTLYQDTDFLLCHDDQLEGRRLAYFLYLSDMEESDGGALHLLDREFKSAVSILPRVNTFALFEVSPHSFHEVEEVVTDKQRIAITGWYHDQ